MSTHCHRLQIHVTALELTSKDSNKRIKRNGNSIKRIENRILDINSIIHHH